MLHCVANFSLDRIQIQITQCKYVGVKYSFLYPAGEQLPQNYCVSIGLAYMLTKKPPM